MILSFRYVSWVAIISSLIGSVLMFIIGAQKTYYSVASYLQGNSEDGPLDTATLYVIKSLDAFLIAFVLYIFSYGIYKLFIGNNIEDKDHVIRWVRISSINQLKQILAELVIIILFVKFLEAIIINFDALQWQHLILPLSIVFLSYALRLLNLAETE